MDGPVLAIFIVVGLVFFGITVWGVVDALQRPDAAWQAAGQNKTTWVALMIVLRLPVRTGLVVSLVYLFSIRPKLIAAQSGGCTERA